MWGSGHRQFAQIGEAQPAGPVADPARPREGIGGVYTGGQFGTQRDPDSLEFRIGVLSTSAGHGFSHRAPILPKSSFEQICSGTPLICVFGRLCGRLLPDCRGEQCYTFEVRPGAVLLVDSYMTHMRKIPRIATAVVPHKGRCGL